jgi:hypothetical protein
MHQMCTSTTQVSSLMLRSTDWLFTVLRPAKEFFTYMEMSPLPVKGCKILAFARRSGPLSSEGSLLCHTRCDTGPRFFLSHPKDRPIQSPHTTHDGLWRVYSNPDQMWKLKELSDGNQTECHEIEPNLLKDRAMPEGNNPSIWDEFTKSTFFLTFQFIFVLVSTETLSNWAVETLGD